MTMVRRLATDMKITGRDQGERSSRPRPGRATFKREFAVCLSALVVSAVVAAVVAFYFLWRRMLDGAGC